ncbi:TIGR02302 family protein [Azospirillum sp. RWY-5-1]|uniref:TIGR02302 family protein n=1 Tax=Azospirillum oleiclasticum TaxID=2735135 RepID=UPI0015D51B85|nr:TIGR02302 family protein [Azospirillum oleiclasticum]NYZ15214.1 TIGR02302 family protein [Azospirillum oleiclasticum]
MRTSDDRNRAVRDNAAPDAAHGTARNAGGIGEPGFRLLQARLALAWERLWPGLWPAASVLGLFIAVAFFNILPTLPGWLHLLALAGFAAGLGVALWRGLRGFTFPDAAAARRRIERDSGLAHRPLHVLRDSVSGNDPMAAALWRLHQERVRDAVKRLRVRMPEPHVAARDRYAVRVLVGLLLFVSAGVAWQDWRARLEAALTPGLSSPAAATASTLDLWVTPPDYTGLAPIFLTSGGTAAAAGPAAGSGAAPAAAPGQPAPGQPAPGQPIAVPSGSQVLARATGGSTVPVLEVNGADAGFEAVETGTFQIQAPVTGGTRIAVRQGSRTMGSWPITVVPDRAPTVAFAQPPAAGERGALRIDYVAQDDYGLTGIDAVVALAAEGLETDPEFDRAPVTLPMGLPGARPKQARSAGFHDLTAHPWAGLPVTLRLSATDGAGQQGHSDEVAMTLPERMFSHPVAREIVEQRKKLTLRPSAMRTEVARALSELSARPGAFAGDIIVFLSLRTAVARLMLDDSVEAIPELQQLLWETALRVEDGGLSLAERDLRDAERRLAEALERNASDEELRRLMDELQTAMDRFLEAMEEQMRQALERGEQIPQMPPEMAQRMDMFDRNDLQRMMDQMRAMAETGAKDAARQMLSQLQQMLESMRSGAMAQMQQNQQNQQMQMMRELQELAQRQQQLLDETFRQSQEQMGNQQGQPQQGPRGRQQQQQQQGQRGGQNNSGSPTMQRQAERQEALRRQLGDIMRRMGETGGEIPRPLGRAERAMRDAGQALRQGQPGSAVPPQTQAMDELQQGMQSMAEQMMQQMQQMMMGAQPGMQPGGQPSQPDPRQVGRNRDPLGRRPPSQGTVDNNDVKIPEEADLQRSREILDELRRRSGEFDRPRPERDYIDRLLRQF